MPPIDLDQPADRPETRVVIAGIGIDLVEMEQGAPCLLLHGIDGIHPTSRHPGCGHSETVRQFHDVRDLAIFYHAFLERKGP